MARFSTTVEPYRISPLRPQRVRDRGGAELEAGLRRSARRTPSSRRSRRAGSATRAPCAVRSSTKRGPGGSRRGGGGLGREARGGERARRLLEEEAAVGGPEHERSFALRVRRGECGALGRERVDAAARAARKGAAGREEAERTAAAARRRRRHRLQLRREVTEDGGATAGAQQRTQQRPRALAQSELLSQRRRAEAGTARWRVLRPGSVAFAAAPAFSTALCRPASRDFLFELRNLQRPGRRARERRHFAQQDDEEATHVGEMREQT